MHTEYVRLTFMLAYPGNLIEKLSTFTWFKCHVFSDAKRI